MFGNLLWRASLAFFITNLEIKLGLSLGCTGLGLISDVFCPGINWCGPRT